MNLKYLEIFAVDKNVTQENLFETQEHPSNIHQYITEIYSIFILSFSSQIHYKKVNK